MKSQKLLLTTAGLVAALSLAGCWDNDDVDPVPPTATTEVPDSAGVSTVAFIGYLLALGAGDESSEPLTLKDSFAVPAEEAAEPTPLI